MKKTGTVLVILFTATLAFATYARATASYDGTLTGSISVAGCFSGAILQNCALSGLDISTSSASSNPTTITSGNGVASATQNVTAGSGTSFSISSAISGSASHPGSSANSLTFPSPTILVRNTGASSVTLALDYSFSYLNSVNIDFPATETALSFSKFDLNRTDSFLGFPFDFQDLFESSCSNINPPQFGLTAAPCSDSGTGRLSVVISGCSSPLDCEGTVTSLSLDAGQIGLAAVVPEPGSLILVILGSMQFCMVSRRRLKRFSQPG